MYVCERHLTPSPSPFLRLIAMLTRLPRTRSTSPLPALHKPNCCWCWCSVHSSPRLPLVGLKHLDPTMSSPEKKTADLDAAGETFAVVPDLSIYANEDMFEEGSVDPVYQAKARVLNAALQEIGMGKYQVRRLRAP